MSDDAHAPNVYTLAVLLFTDNLRGHVEGRAEDLTEALAWLEEARESKVSQLYSKFSFFSSLLRR